MKPRTMLSQRQQHLVILPLVVKWAGCLTSWIENTRHRRLVMTINYKLSIESCSTSVTPSSNRGEARRDSEMRERTGKSPKKSI